MLKLLRNQIIGNRRGRPAGGRRRPTRARGAVRQKFFDSSRHVSRIAGFLPDTFRILFGKNRYFVITTVCLLCLFLTGFVFSRALQGSLPAAIATEAAVEAEEDTGSRALAAAYDELGSGTFSSVRDKDVEYVLQEGDSLYSIGKLYVIKAEELKEYNKIADPNRLRVGSVITIPSREHLAAWNAEQEKARLAARKAAPAALPRPASLLPPQVAISAVTEKDGPVFKALFSADTELPEQGVRYEWDLGDGGVSRNPRASHTYLEPGTYAVSLSLRDTYGYERRSNTLTIEVSSTEGASLVRTMYLSVGGVGDTFALKGKVTQMEDTLGRVEKPVQLVEEREGSYFYRALAAGNFSLIARGPDAVYKVYLFVSPFPSVHSDRFDTDWYRTQYNTGFSNCGPATVSMAVGWAKGNFISVTSIRKFVGWRGDGGTSFTQLEKALAWKGLNAQTIDITGMEDVFQAVDRGEIAIVLFHTGRISRAKGRPELNYVGRYYSDSVGHYVIVKGYTEDKKYLVVYDPMPSDWASNGNRYGDGVSMIGRNRYYPVAEMNRALSLRKILIVSR
jgi:PKD repeat protein